MSFAALVYVLASVALVVQIGAHRLLEGVWGVDGPSLVRLAVVTVAQAVALLLVRGKGRRRGESGGVSPGAAEATTEPASALGSFLGLWLLLGAINALLGAAVSGLFLEHLDLRFVAFLKLLVVPAAQSVVLPWVESRWSFTELGRELAGGLRDRAVWPVLAGAALTMTASLFVSGSSAWSAGGLHLLWAGGAAIAAGVMLIVAGVRRPWPRAQQLALILLGAWAVVLGLDPFVAWIPRLTGLLPERWPTVLAWATVGGAMAVVSFGLLVAGSRTALSRFGPAGLFLDAAGGVGFAIALVAVLSTFLRRYPTPLASAVLTTGVALAATLAAVGSLLLLRHGGEEA